MRKKCIALLISLLLVCPVAACKKTPSPDGSTGAGEIEFWSTYATEKVLQDRTDLYDGVKMEAAVNVAACQGEYESAQLIMTAKKAVKAYNAWIADDLTGPGGAIFRKSDITLRSQKYIQVSVAYSSYNDPPVGWYPDALLPLDTVVEYKENHIGAGANQGLYVTFHVPYDQAPGDYTGSLQVTYDGQVQTIPVRLTVYDLAVSRETRSQSYFNLGFTQHMGELDGTESIWRTYAESLLEYRISPSIVMRNLSATDEGMTQYVDTVYDLVKNHGMSTINAPWKGGADLTAFLVKLAQKSVTENIDLLAKTIVKGPDEPKVSALGSVTTATNSFNDGVSKAKAQFDGLKSAGASDTFIAQLKASADKIPFIIALQYARNDATDAAGVDTYCPLYDKYDSEEGRAQYDDQYKGRWWYGCITPRPPYPTYHTEDTLASARSIGWMMSEYDVVGNLYWGATVYARYDGAAYQPIEDYYTGQADRFLACNGDGYLFYPGAPYGLNKPVASMRLEAIRDGNEEYELLYDLRQAYKTAHVSPDAIQRNISDLIYSGTKVRFNNISEQFAAARKAMIQLAMLADAGVYITDVQDDNKGVVTYKITAGRDCVLKNGDAELTGVDNGNRVDYTVSVRLENDSNALRLSAAVGDKTYAFDFALGGKVTYYAGEQLLNADNTFAAGNAAVTATPDNGRIKLEIGETVDKHQNIRYTSSVLGSIPATAKRLVLFVENAGDATEFRLLVRLKNNSLNTEVYSGTLDPGVNLLEINLESVNLSAGGAISYADMYFTKSSEGTHAARTVYLNGLTVYGG